jgi:hypothetical protein
MYPCIQTRCGFYSMMLNITANPTQYSATATVINYSFTITNTGSEPISYPIIIQTTTLGLGSTTIYPGYLAPGQNYVSQNLFSYTTQTGDVVSGAAVTLTATAQIQIECNRMLTSQQAQAISDYVAP